MSVKLYGMKKYVQAEAFVTWESCSDKLFTSREECARDFMEQQWPDVVAREFKFLEPDTHPAHHFLNAEFFNRHQLVRFFIEYKPTPANPYTQYTSDAHLIFQYELGETNHE